MLVLDETETASLESFHQEEEARRKALNSPQETIPLAEVERFFLTVTFRFATPCPKGPSRASFIGSTSPWESGGFTVDAQ